MNIKVLKQDGIVFVPLTVAEGVLVKDNGNIITLNTVLDKKIENIITDDDSGLTSTKKGTFITLTHSDTINANAKRQSVKIKYNSTGHIIESSPLIITVNNIEYNYDDVQMGDDFEIDEENKIRLKWNNI